MCCITGQFDNNEPLHLQMLQTVYKVLTATAIDCPRYGSHWDLIGFQVSVRMVKSLLSKFMLLCYSVSLLFCTVYVFFLHMESCQNTGRTGIKGNNFTLHVLYSGNLDKLDKREVEL